jgi:hypothetical protein
MDADGAADEQHRRRTAKSCGPDASTLASSLRRQTAGDGDKQARSPRRSRRKPLKPLRAGMPGQSGEPTVTTSCAYYPFRTRDCGCIEHPAFPTPFIGRKMHAQLGRIRAARMRDRILIVIANSKSTLSRHSGAMRSIEPGIHNPVRGYGFRACAKRRIHDVQLHIGE